MIGAILLGNTLTQIWPRSLATSIAIALLGRSGIAAGTAATTAGRPDLLRDLAQDPGHPPPQRRGARPRRCRCGSWSGCSAPVVAAVQVLVDGMLRIFGVKLEAPMLPKLRSPNMRGADRHPRRPGDIRDERKMLGARSSISATSTVARYDPSQNLAVIDADQPIAAVIDQIARQSAHALPL